MLRYKIRINECNKENIYMKIKDFIRSIQQMYYDCQSLKTIHLGSISPLKCTKKCLEMI